LYGPRAFAEILQNRSTTLLTIPEMPLRSNSILQPGRKDKEGSLSSCVPWNLT